MSRILSAAAVLVLLITACGNEPPTAERRREDVGSALEGIPLREDEAPDGLEVDEGGTGAIGSLREVLPPRSRFPSLPPVPRRLVESFRGGYEVVYRRVQDGERGSPASAASSAIRFADSTSADTFLAYLEDVQVGTSAPPNREEVPVEGLGNEAYGWHQTVPRSESAGYAWRAGDVVLTVTLGGPIGSAGPEHVLALARRVAGRVPSGG